MASRVFRRKKPFSGAWVNENVPDLTAVLRGFDIDSSAFAAWLAPRVGNLRFSAEMQKQLPTRVEEMKALRALRVKALDASDALSAVFPGTSAALHYELFKAGGPWSTTLDRDLAQGLRHLCVFLSIVESKFEEQARLRRGPRTKATRDILLSDVADELFRRGVPKRALARKLAAEILTKCGVDVPSPESRATQRAQKKGTLIRKSAR